MASMDVLWKRVRFCIYMALGWGIPALLTVIPASAGRMAFESSAT